jgi:hypothetical protein
MTAAARKLAHSSNPTKKHAARPSALAVFTARCEARAKLWQAGELDLHDAVDALQAAAVRDGLVTELGQQEVQRLMSAAFGAVRDDLITACDQVGTPLLNAADDAWSAPSWHEAAVEYRDGDHHLRYQDDELGRLRSLMADNVTLERAWAEVSRPTGLAASTIKAADHLVREGDAERLARWLTKHGADERTAIQKHLGGEHAAKPRTD